MYVESQDFYCRRHVRIPTPFSPPFLLPLILSLTSRGGFGASPILRSCLPPTESSDHVISHKTWFSDIHVHILSFVSLGLSSIYKRSHFVKGRTSRWGIFRMDVFSLTRRFFFRRHKSTNVNPAHTHGGRCIRCGPKTKA
jgi:hypothetical protein